jgi:hypothetical protein
VTPIPPFKIWHALDAFAREELGRPIFGKLQLSPDMRLEEDLGLTGVDAIAFIDKWVETFAISAECFPYARYFGPESFDLTRTMLGVFSSRFRQAPQATLTLGMLAEAMRLGRWDTDTLEAAEHKSKR